MKTLIVVLLFCQSLLGLEHSKQLPQDTIDLIDSFECFSKKDKDIIRAYVLLLDYRIEHVDDYDIYDKTDKDYWKLNDYISDVFYNCGLVYDFDKTLEATFIATKNKRDRFSRLRREEGKTYYTRDKYEKNDTRLPDHIAKHPLQFSIIPSINGTHNYNLKTLKQHQKNTIPTSTYVQISSTNLNRHQKNTLFKIANLEELKIRNYDNPKKLKKISWELAYLEICRDYFQIFDIVIRNNVNKKRTLALSIQNRYDDRKDILPQDAKQYCEKNITNMNIGTFRPKRDSVFENKVEKVKIIKLENLKSYLEKYSRNKIKYKKAKKYYATITKSLSPQTYIGTPNLESLELIRLMSCLGDDKNLMKALIADIEKEDLKESFITRVWQSQQWWMTTIGMKIRAEGNSTRLASFFDCNSTELTLKPPVQIKTKNLDYVHIDYRAIDNAKKLNANIFRYFSTKFYKNASQEINTTSAIELSIVPLKWIESNRSIRSPFGGNVSIESTPQGGIKTTFTGVPSGTACARFAQIQDSISFNREQYEGIDYVLIDSAMVKTKHHINLQIEKHCKIDGNHTISFVRIRPPRKYKYKKEPPESVFSKYVKVGDFWRRNKNIRSFSTSSNKKWFAYSGDTTICQSSDNIYGNYKTLKNFKNKRPIAISDDGQTVVGYDTNGLTRHDKRGSVLLKSAKVPSRHEMHKRVQDILFIDKNQTIVTFEDNWIRIYDIQNDKLVGEIKPSFIKNLRSSGVPNNRTKITALTLSADKKLLYVAGGKNNKGSTIEVWEIKKSSDESIETRFKKVLIGISSARISSLSINNNYPNILLCGSRLKIYYYSLLESRTIKEFLPAHGFKSYSTVEMSDDGKWVMGFADAIDIWRNTEPSYPHEVLSGDNIRGSMFLPGSNNLLIQYSNSISLWATKNKHKQVKRDLNKRAYQYRVKNSKQPIFDAIIYHQNNALESLLKNGAKVAAINKLGLAPLHTATIHNNKEAVKILLKSGADLNLPSASKPFRGATAYEFALHRDIEIGILKLFLEHGADVNKKFKSTSHSPLGSVLKLCQDDTKKTRLLLEMGADGSSIAKIPTKNLLKIKCNNKKMLRKNIELIKKIVAEKE